MAATMEDVIEQTGGCGRYQITMTTCVHFCKTVLIFTQLFMVFGASVPDWWCVDDLQNTTSFHPSSFKSCSSGNETRTCEIFSFDPSSRTIVSEWKLVCDKTWIVSTITSLQMAGLFIGNTLGGHAADVVGRKPAFYGAILAMVVLNFVAIFSTSWIMFTIIRLLLGAACGFQLTVQYTIQCEFMPTRWRSFGIVLPTWHVILMLYTLIGMLFNDWRHLHIAAVAFGVVSLASFWLVQESFRWRVAHDRTEDAFKIVNFVAKINKMPKPDMQELDNLAEHIRQEDQSLQDRHYTLLDLIRTRPLLRYTLPLMVIWFSAGMSLYGIQFAVHKLPGNIYINYFIYTGLSIAGNLVVIYTQNRFGRKWTFTGLLIIFTTAAAAVGVAYRFEASSARGMASRVCALISVSGINCAFTSMQTMTLELYPTVVRNIGFGIQNTMARAGAVIGPQLVLLDPIMPGLMYFVIAFVGILSILSLRPLPETKDLDLQDRLPVKQVHRDRQETDGVYRIPESPLLLDSSRQKDV